MNKTVSYIIACVLAMSNVHAEKENIFLTIAAHHLPTFTKTEMSVADEYKALEKQRHSTDIQTKKLSDHETHEIVYKSLATRGDKKHNVFTDISDETTWRDLELFCGPKSNKAMHLFKQLDYTKTVHGKAVLQRIISQPTTNIAELKKRQAVIREIASNKTLRRQLKKILTKAAIGEQELLAMSSSEELMNEKRLDIFYSMIFEKQIPVKQIKDFVDRSPIYLGITGNNFLLEPGLICVSAVFGAISTGALIAAIASWSPKAKKGFYHDLMLQIDMNPNSTLDWAICAGTGSMFAGCISFIAGIIAAGCTAVAYYANKSFKQLQHKLSKVSKLCRSLDEIEKLVTSNKTLAKHVSITHIQNLKEKSLTLKRTLYNLKTDTFKGKATIFSYRGRIAATYKLLLDVRHEFTQALEELGLIDAYASAAKMHNKFKSSNTPYCFTQYKTSPHVECKAEDFWFPALLNNENVKHIVTNSIHLGGNKTSNPANIILTGPNTGGKSTILKGLIITAWLSQTLGIAPARNVVLTPFDKIMSCLNLTDDTSRGISLYKANLMRAKELINSAKHLKPSQKGLYVCDEPFNGTSKEETEQGFAYIAAEYVKRSNCIGILSTHFNTLTNIADLTNGAFTNYKVISEKHGNEPRIYHYTWAPGINHDHVARELMEAEGLNNPDYIDLVSHFSPQKDAS